MKLLRFAFIFLFFAPVLIFAEEQREDIKEKLERLFLNTFSSSHQFSSCQLFQVLGYDLAEIDQIKRITPYPASLSVEFSGLKIEPEKISFDELKVICTKVHYFGMVIEKLAFGFPKSAIETNSFKNSGKLRFIVVSNISLKAEVSESDLLNVMRLYGKSSLLSHVKIGLNAGQARCKGRVKMGFMTAEFDIKGHIKQLSPKRVNFIFDKMRINGITQPRAFVSSIMKYINPVFDSSKIWINLNVSEMRIKEGFVETLASIDKKE